MGEKVKDSQIIEILKYLREDSFLSVEGGSKSLSKYLRRDYGIIVNHKKVARLCKENKLLLKKRGKKKSKFKNCSINHSVTRENQVWEFDLKYGYLHGEKRFFFLLAFIDVFTRGIKGWYLGRHCKADDLLTTFKLALGKHQISPEDQLFIRSDNGSQMSAKIFEDGIKGLPVEHEFIPVRTPNKNAHIESFFSIYDRHLQEQYFWSLRDAYHWTLEFMDFYNEHRIHGSLGMSPVEFAKRKELHGLEKFKQAI